MTRLQIVECQAGIENINPSTPIDDLGLDSLEFVDLMNKLEIPRQDWPRLVTVADLL